MKELSRVFAALRRRDRGQYALLFGCLFGSALLITAFSLMMRSPTVLNVLPVGGCGAFTLYATGLFFRHKSKEVGIFLALGAARSVLSRQLGREVFGLALAANHGVTVTDFVALDSSTLAVDGMEHMEQETSLGVTYTEVYRPQLQSGRFFSETAWNALTGDHLDLFPGEVAGVFNGEGYGLGRFGNEISLLTNPVTGQTLSLTPSETILKNNILFSCRVLDDGDYAAITQGLTDDWRHIQVLFNAENDSYAFAKALFYEIVDRSDESMRLDSAYDPIVHRLYQARGEVYFADPDYAEVYAMPAIDYTQPDGMEFRQNWMYMPQFRILDQADSVTTMAVFLMLFVFVALLCFAAVGVILFTRRQLRIAP